MNNGKYYQYHYGDDLEAHYDKLTKFKTKPKIFCSDCKIYYKQGEDNEGKQIILKNGCRGRDLEWETCLYKKFALEAMNNE